MEITDIKKEREKIFEELHKIEEEINRKVNNDSFLTKKKNQIDLIRENLKEKTFISEGDFNKLKQFAVSKGGFILNENRRDLWKKILNVDLIEDKFNFIFIKEHLHKYQTNDIFQNKIEETNKGNPYNDYLC